MISCLTYRPRRIEFEGCAPLLCGPVSALACHKGDASQAQTSQQTGAQTGGVATSGTKNKVSAIGNSGSYTTQIQLGSSSGKNNTSNITVTDNGAIALASQDMQSAIDALAAANSNSAAVNTTEADAFTNGINQISGNSSNTMAALKEVATWAAVLGCGYLVVKIASKE